LKKAGGKYGGIRMHNADQHLSGPDDKYSHNKYVLVNGVYDGNRSSKLVFTGSANFTQVGLRYNNEVVVKLRANTAYDLYHNNFQTIYSFKTKTAAVPPPTLVEGRPEKD
jgi:phosphatidylserine/phosphatidylglycerophosphate/cardiolipin synthase-like enzyme